MYQSPIEIITKQMQAKFEDDVFKAVQQYGINIDKDELIKALKYDRDQYEKGYRDGLFLRGELIAGANEWISVDERLPSESGKYLVCTKNGNVYQTKFYSYPENKGGHWGQKDKGKNITHWMPLPEAPKGGE